MRRNVSISRNRTKIERLLDWKEFPSKSVGLFVLFVFVALRPKSTAMVIAGRSVHLTTRFPGQA